MPNKPPDTPEKPIRRLIDLLLLRLRDHGPAMVEPGYWIRHLPAVRGILQGFL